MSWFIMSSSIRKNWRNDGKKETLPQCLYWTSTFFRWTKIPPHQLSCDSAGRRLSACKHLTASKSQRLKHPQKFTNLRIHTRHLTCCHTSPRVWFKHVSAKFKGKCILFHAYLASSHSRKYVYSVCVCIYIYTYAYRSIYTLCVRNLKLPSPMFT